MRLHTGARPHSFNMTLKVYTDGSCISTGKKKVRSSIGVYINGGTEITVSEELDGKKCKNQVAELHAIRRGLEVAGRNDDLEIMSDCLYSVNCVTVQAEEWRERERSGNKGKKTENLEVVMHILRLMEEVRGLGHKVSVKWVKGHSGIQGNNNAHNLARKALRSPK